MLKKFFISFISMLYIVTIICSNLCWAAPIPITDENLSLAIQNFVASEANEDNYEVTVSNNVINIKVENETYSMTYDLTNKPIFTMETLIQKGISYNEFNDKTENLILPMLGYIAVANIQGVGLEDAGAYFLFSYMGSALSGGALSSENLYTIVDDLNLDEGVTLQKTDDPKTIYTSEFGEKVLEYVNEVYKNPQTISDSSGINSYVMTIEKVNIDDTSCKIVSKLIANYDADFSQIKGYSEQMDDAFMDSSITRENANYVIDLKVGQKCKIQSNAELRGYAMNSSDCIEFSDDRTEITAIKEGKTNGTLYVGDEEKTVYITVEDNPEGIYVQDKTLYIELENYNNSEIKPDIAPEITPAIKPDIEENDEENNSENGNVDIYEGNENSDLPKTGIGNTITIVLTLGIGLCIILAVNLIKLKDVK